MRHQVLLAMAFSLLVGCTPIVPAAKNTSFRDSTIQNGQLTFTIFGDWQGSLKGLLLAGNVDELKKRNDFAINSTEYTEATLARSDSDPNKISLSLDKVHAKKGDLLVVTLVSSAGQFTTQSILLQTDLP